MNDEVNGLAELQGNPSSPVLLAAFRPSRSQTPRPPIFGDFRVISQIATGGMAEIYLVESTVQAMDRRALKMIRPEAENHPEFRQLLLREAELHQSFDHPNIVRAFGLIEESGQIGILMEHITGVDLRRFEKIAVSPMPLAWVVYIVTQVLDALDYIHHMKAENTGYLSVVHRDLSPGNVMLGLRGEIKLLDFGIAELVRKDNDIKQSSVVRGKFRYMSPEQINNQGTTFRSDLYSTAVLLWEMLAGQRIYQNQSTPEMMMHVSKGEVPEILTIRPDLAPEIQEVLIRALSLEPQERFPSARAFRDAIDAWLPRLSIRQCKQEIGNEVERFLAQKEEDVSEENELTQPNIVPVVSEV